MNGSSLHADVPVTAKLRLYQAGQLVSPGTLTTWRSYTLRTSTLSLSPRDAIHSERIADDAYLLSTGGWMGELKIRVDEGAFTLRISDPKFSNEAWGRLLDDLAAAVVALPLAEHVDGSAVQEVPGPATRFVQRLVLRAYAQQVLSAVQAIRHRPHEALENEPEWTTPDRATTATPAALAAALQRGDFITSGAVAARLGGAAPTAWLDQRQRRHADTPENRFARHALEVMLELTRWFPDDEVLAPLTMEIRSALTRPPFRDAGPYRRFPGSSRVLQRRFGYRELRDAFLALAGAARVRWDGLDAAIRGGLRNTEVLYQYWCFLALQRHLGVVRPALPTVSTGNALHIKLAEGDASYVATPRGRLWHEKTFSAPQAAYAVPLRPDFALERSDGRWDLFDAKFRLDERAEAKHDDLTKMHAYRDAIRACHTARVLYPGILAEMHPATPGEPIHDPGGIGVIPMRP